MDTLDKVAAQPSAFDSARNYAGTPLKTFANLYVVLSLTRDADVLTLSNWEVALKQLGGEDNEHVLIHRFGHWACGRVEYLCVDESKREEGEEIQNSLEDYPVLDDMDFSEREYEVAAKFWASLRVKDRVEICQKFRINIFAARREDIPEDSTGEIIGYLAHD